MDRIPRKGAMVGGGIGVGGSLILIGLLYATGANDTTAGQYTIIVFIEVYVVLFSCSRFTFILAAIGPAHHKFCQPHGAYSRGCTRLSNTSRQFVLLLAALEWQSIKSVRFSFLMRALADRLLPACKLHGRLNCVSSPLLFVLFASDKRHI